MLKGQKSNKPLQNFIRKQCCRRGVKNILKQKIKLISNFEDKQMYKKCMQLFAQLTFNFRKYSLGHYICFRIITILLFAFNIFYSLNYSIPENDEQLFSRANIEKNNANIITLEISHIIFLFLTMLLILLSYEVFKQLIKNHKFKFFARWVQSLPLFCPILLTFFQIALIYQNSTSTANLALLFVFLVLICGLWITRILFIKQNYLNANVKIKNQQQILEVIMFTGNIILTIGFFNQRIVKGWSIINCILLIVHKFYNVSYLYEELEYIDFLGKIIYLKLIVLSYIFQFYPNDTTLLLVSTVIFFISLERMNLFKLVFQIKYKKLLELRSKYEKIEDIIILSHVASHKDKKLFTFFFYKLLDSSIFQYLIYFTKNTSLNLHNSLKNPIRNLLEYKYSESKHTLYFKNYLIYWYLQNYQYLKAITISAELNYHKEEFFYIYYSELSNLEMNSIVKRCQRTFQIVESNTTQDICFINKKQQQLNSNQIIQHEDIVMTLIEKIKSLNYMSNSFLKKLNNENLSSGLIEETLIKQYQLKQQILFFIQKHDSKLKKKQFLLVAYIFLSVYCSKRYSIFNYFFTMLQKIEQNYYLLKKKFNVDKYLVVLISGENDNIGMITNANVAMKLFFNLKDDQIQQKNISIDQFLPTSIAQKHNQFIHNFKHKGVSNFIGKNKDMYMMHNQHCILVEIYVKIFPSINGLTFSGRIRVINQSQHIILYNLCGYIEAISQEIEECINMKEIKNIVDILEQPELKKSIRRNRPQINLKVQNFQMIKLKNKIMKAKMKYLSGQNYFLGICNIISYQRNFHFQSKSRKSIVDNHRSYSLKSIEKESVQKNTQKFLETQNRLQNIDQNDPTIKEYKLAIFGIIFFIIFGFSYTQGLLNQYTAHLLQSIEYYNQLSADFVPRNFQTYNIFLLIDAVQTGYINDNIAEKYNITSFQSYLRDTAQQFLSNSASIEYTIDKNIQTFTAEQSNFITVPAIGFSVSKSNVTLSLIQALSLQKNFLTDTFYSTPANFAKDFSINFRVYQYLTNYLSSLAIQMYTQIYNKMTNNLVWQNDQLLMVICCVFGTIIIIVIMNILIRHKITKKKKKYIQLLNNLKNEDICNKYKLNQNSQRLLNTIAKYSIDYVEISDEIDNFCCVINKSQHIFREGKIDFRFHMSSSTSSIIKNTFIPKFKIQNRKIKEYKFKIDFSDVFAFFFMITPLTFYIIEAVLTTNWIKDQIDVYQAYKTEIETLKTNLPLLFNIPIYNILFKNVTQSFFNIPSTKLLQTIEGQIYHRSFQNMLQNYLDWTTYSNFLYNSHCDPQDHLCKTLLSGIFKQPVSSIIIQFTSRVILVTNQMKNNTYPYNSNILDQICQLQISYQQYLSPILQKASDYGIDISTKIIAQNLSMNNKVFMFMILPVTIISILWQLHDLKKKQQTLQIIKKEMLSFDSVEILSQKIQFSYQFNKI